MDKSYIKIFSMVKLVGVGDVRMTLRKKLLPLLPVLKIFSLLRPLLAILEKNGGQI